MENRGIGYILKKTWALYSGTVAQATGFAAMVLVPMYAAMALLMGNKDLAWLYFLAMIVIIPASIWIYGGLTWFLSEHYEGRSPQIGEAIAAVTPKAVRFVSVILLASAIMIGGFFLFIIPGIYWALKYMPSYIAVMVENKDVGALRISGVITKGKKWMMLGAGLLVFVPIFAVSILIMVATGYFTTPVPTAASIAANGVFALITMPFMFAFYVAMYKALREDAGTVDPASVKPMDEALGCVVAGISYIGAIILIGAIVGGLTYYSMKVSGKLDELKAKQAPTQQVK